MQLPIQRLFGFLPLFLLPLCFRIRAVCATRCSQWDMETNKAISRVGDVIIGGMFSLYNVPESMKQDYTQPPQYKRCEGLHMDLVALQSLYVMDFAVEEINRNKSLLPGLTLGYTISDICGGYPSSPLLAALSVTAGKTDSCKLENSTTDNAGGLNVIIGPDSSSSSIYVSNALKPFSVPLISYLAICPCLSDKERFPSFFRTVPSDTYQTRALAHLAIHFKWSWLGVIVANNDYGRLAVQVFQQEVKGKGVCLDFVLFVARATMRTDAIKAADRIQASSAQVIMIFCWYTDVIKIFTELLKRNITDRQFLSVAAWSTSEAVLQNKAISKLSHGVVGVAIRSAQIPGLGDYVRSLHPSERPHDVFLRDYWEREFGCTYVSSPSASLPPCTGAESLSGVHSHFTDVSHLRRSYNVYLGVYAAAHGLHSLLSCHNSDTSTSGCSSPKHFTSAQLVQHLNKVTISTPHGDVFSFQNGDFPSKFDYVNWQRTPDGNLINVVIGHVDERGFFINESAVQWSSASGQVPVSVCTKSCEPGTRKAIRKGEPVCCFDCIPCGDGEISNRTDSLQCDRCPLEFWSDPARTICIRRQLDFLSFNETLGITLTTVAVSGAVVTTAVFVVFIYYRQTPMVRANNIELSFLLLVSLKLCFLCSLVFIGRPSVWSCRFQQAAFGISFVLCVSCLLVKTMVVLVAFRSARPGSETLLKWFGPHQQRGSVGLFTTVQVIICIVWLSISPPEPHLDLGVQGSKVTLECAMESVLGFSLVLGYIGLLACSCLLLAFLARKLPDNFNEAKLITFSMLIFCAVWVAFVPAYVSSPGKYVVAVEIFAILASSYGLLFCLFAPKCFIILLRPEKNSKKNILGK